MGYSDCADCRLFFKEMQARQNEAKELRLKVAALEERVRRAEAKRSKAK